MSEESEYQGGSGRCVIHGHCTRHGGTPGFTNLVARKCKGQVEPDPHVTGRCVITLDEPGATVLRDALMEWLG